MDHDDWSHWSADGVHPDDADTADLHGAADQPDLHAGLGDFADHDDLGAHDLPGHDLPGHDPGGAAHETHAGHEGFPEDDPFDHAADHDAADHDEHAAPS